MEHRPKRRRLFGDARNGGATRANSKGRDSGIESHAAECMEHGDLHFVGPQAASLVELRHQNPHIEKAVSVDPTERTGVRHWELHRRFPQVSVATLTDVVTVVVDTVETTQTTDAVSVVVDTVEATQTAGASSTVSSDSSAQLPTVPSVSASPTLTLPTVPAFPFTTTSTPVISPTASNFPFGNSTSTGFGRNSSTTTTAFSNSNFNSTTIAFTTSLNSTSTSSTTSLTSTESSTSSTETASSSSTASSGNGPNGGGGPATSTGGSGAPTSTAGPGSGIGSGIQKPAVIGGLVGGLAGVALLLILALLFIRSRKERLRRRTLGPTVASDPAGSVSGSLSGPTGILSRFRSASPQVETSEASSPGERGFYRVSGRKIPPVLGGGGGDGFGSGFGEESLSGPSDPFVAGASGDRGTVGSSERIIALRPSPARTPVIGSSTTRESSLERPRPFRDGLGRSHPSEDGSKASRFVEDV